MKQRYLELTFRKSTLQLIGTINEILSEYKAMGFKLTVRQLYYQLVARGMIENNEKSYKRTAKTINDGRLAGLIDWDMIEDRTRDFIKRSHWTGPKSIIRSAAQSFHMDMWATQDTRVFCIVEKEALVGVLEGVCHQYDVPLLAARGYPSVSVVREFVEEDLNNCDASNIIILHLGDHDPSGIDMTRDLTERVELFTDTVEFTLKRLALNMPQIEELKPPPNPAKTTDARFVQYRKKFGSQSWELDALSPTYLEKLVRDNITLHIDGKAWEERQSLIQETKEKIEGLVKHL